ncbi:DNA-3-methyladenine glycosylase I [Desulfomarina sp.]
MLKNRCEWCGEDPLYRDYHDKEWGVPLHDERKLFEFLCLEGAQAGLSWLTILRKRSSYQKAFDYFNAEKMAGYDENKIKDLLLDKGIVRNKLKISAFINNARCYLAMIEKGETLDAFFWKFVDGSPVQNSWKSIREVPVTTPLAESICRELKQRGFKFVGATICYAHIQAMGMVNDHLVDCFRYREVAQLA